MEPSTPTPAPKPASRGRVLLYALLPLFLLALLTGAVRLVTDAEQKQAAITDAPPRRDPANPMEPLVAPPALLPADEKTQAAMETVVRGQLRAIAAQDFSAALSFAVPPLRESTNPQGFRRVIENGYAPMLAMKRVEVVNARVRTGTGGDKTALMDVIVVTRTGERTEYGYMLQSVGSGWQVQGVMTRPSLPPQGENENATPPRRSSDLPVL